MHPQSGLGDWHPTPATDAPPHGIFLAQVIAVYPENHALGVITQTGTLVQGPRPTSAAPASPPSRLINQPGALQCRVLEHRSGPNAGTLSLPQVGEWGLIVFPEGASRLPVWLGSINQDFNNLATPNGAEQIDHHPSGVWRRIDQAGNLELVYPDGSYLRMGVGTALTTDPDTGTPRVKQVMQPLPGNLNALRIKIPYTIPILPAPTLYLKHSSGLTLACDPSGNLTISGPGTKQETITGAVTEDYQATKSETVGQEWTLTVGATGQMTFTGSLTIEAVNIILNPETGIVTLGGAVGTDFVAFLSALTKIVTAFNSHTHTDPQGGTTGVPNQTVSLVAGTDYAQKVKGV